MILIKLIERATSLSPAARQQTVRFWYQVLSRLDRQGIMPFMNYGYAELDPAAPHLALAPPDEPHRYCIQLYRHVAGAVSLAGRDLLEVGCGRGGGANYLARTLAPRSVTGVDFSDQAIRYCRQTYRQPGLRFVPGDAAHLPFDAASFDVVVNIESSHSYPSLARFLAEVYRVLRPGGHLLYADFRPSGALASWRQQLVNAGFGILAEHTITANVVHALDVDSSRKQALIARHAPRLISARFGEFAGLSGSPIYRRFSSGELVYRSFALQRAG